MHDHEGHLLLVNDRKYGFYSGRMDVTNLLEL